MSATSMYIVDMMREVVSDVSTALGYTAANTPLNYMYGPLPEIVNKLIIYTRHEHVKNPKYPLIALITDVPHRVGESAAYYADVTLNLIIVTLTRSEYFAEDRTTNVFKPTLNPIYEELKNQICESRYFNIQDDRLIPHTMTPRYNWGRSALFTDNGGGTDFIDGIELSNLVLRIKENNCKNYNKNI